MAANDFLEQRLDRVLGSGAKKLAAGFEMETVGDLLRHYPHRYVERGKVSDLRELKVDEMATVVATVRSSARRYGRTPKQVRLEVVVGEPGSARQVTVTFFGHKMVNLFESKLRPGVRAMFSGKVTLFSTRHKTTWQLTHPDCALLPDDADDASRMRPVIPIYSITSRVKLSSWQIASSVQTVLDVMGPLDDPLPADVRREHRLLGLAEALEKIHRPYDRDDYTAARHRLRFDEAFVAQVALAQRRAETAAMPAVARRGRSDGLRQRFDAGLPFTLTTGQREVGEQVAAEITRPHPMHRLLQGEVGSGKTLVALRAMLQVVDSGGQAALLAPTEVLAQQHHRSIRSMLGDLAEGGMLGGADDGTRVALLTGSLSSAARKEAMLDAASGAAGIVVGTHALLEERVQFADLGLVVVDEQHRFGVEQRAALTAKAGDTPPHVLVMTATPIPRTVAMTVFGDLDVSAMRDLPPGRSPIQTAVVPATERPDWLDRGWQRVREEVANGHQAYVVCSRVGDTGEVSPKADEVPPASVVELTAELRDGPLRGLRVQMLHGRMAADDKDTVMAAFAAGEVDVLVATTVIEVGVDVPNASMMVVVDADRFGISQLHQLRGRVGRGSVPGLCLLVTSTPAGSAPRTRLDAVAATTDGFALSQVDLQTRREGDVLGVAQSGTQTSLRLLSVLHHEDVITQARDIATRVVRADPQLARHPALAEAVSATLGSTRGDYLEMT
ncbi:MAG TPA: ATP-dependent DNA helicase RecG [Nocardioidaceae bacterium]|nr:ATP-dependent DNA helicase RecG [Nocardioidaceae bacterium]